MLFSKTPKDGEWRPYTPWFFVRLSNGKLSDALGQVWRRWVAGAWEYRQDEETEQDVLDRQAF